MRQQTLDEIEQRAFEIVDSGGLQELSIAATIGGAVHPVIPAKQTLTMGRLYAAMIAGAATRALHRCHHT